MNAMTAMMANLSPLLANANLQDRLWFGDGSFTEAGSQSDWMFQFIWWCSVVSFVGLMGLMLWFSFVYRRRQGKAAPASPHHNTILEITWTIIPTIFFFVMFFEGFRGYINMSYAPVGAIECNVTARQWQWGLEYPGGQISSEFALESEGARSNETKQFISTQDSPVWYFPAEQPVLLRMTSTDVIHSFWVPDFRMKYDVFPNRYTSYTFTPDALDDSALMMEDEELGAYRYRDHIVFCAEYCGDFHSEMAAIIRVVPREIYEAKLEIFGSPRGTLAERGKLVATQNGCFACHSVNGDANTGPTWQNLYNNEHQYADGSTVLADDNHIRESIYEPAAKIRAGYPNQMVSYQGNISTEQLGWVIAYMKTLSEATPEAERAAAEVDPDAEGGEGEATEGEGESMEGTPSGG